MVIWLMDRLVVLMLILTLTCLDDDDDDQKGEEIIEKMVFFGLVASPLDQKEMFVVMGLTNLTNPLRTD